MDLCRKWNAWNMERMQGIDRKLTHIPASDLHDVWGIVRPGLVEIINNISPDWIPEDVYAALRSGTSTLHVGYDCGEYDGFVVVTPTPEYYGICLFVWCAYSNGTDGITKYLAEIEEMARTIKAKRIRFASPRKGFSRLFREVTTVYEKEL